MQNIENFLFKVYDRDDEMGNRCHFEWEGKGAFAFQVMVDGYRMAADALYDKCKQERGNYP
ncbi:MAG: hypothetical protein K2O01_06465 [Bacteroidales bacterium]|nr:hypothetical protein [Bacteroidales bacterium]